MLSYRHGFHAGNHGDIVKHLVLSLVIDYLKKKSSPIRYIDTHAGAGLYSVVGQSSLKTGEYAKGVGSLDLPSLPDGVEVYREVISKYLLQGTYPGSPLIAAELLRAQDELRFFELHPAEFPMLQQRFASDRRVRVKQEDGYNSLKTLLPVQNARVLVLVDPSYELKNEFRLIVSALAEGISRMPNAVFLLWYPVLSGKPPEALLRKIAALGIDDVWCYELSIEENCQTVHGMHASGMLVINPPWIIGKTLPPLLEAISGQLPYANASFSVKQIQARQPTGWPAK